MDGDWSRPQTSGVTILLSGGASLSFFDLKPEQDSFLGEVLAGLSGPQKRIPAKFFYDRRGCELFEAICDLPEYYLTRTETALMRQYAGEMAQCLGPGCMLIEYGSGNGSKTRILLEALAPPVYMPIDIAGEQLRHSAFALAEAFPRMRIAAVCADYSLPLELPEHDEVGVKRKVVYFPGSTIGNFTPAETLAFLKGVVAVVGAGGAMLVGVDLKKPSVLLTAAYDDTQGVTAEFNLNLLARINRELDGNFNLANFRHQAFYNEPAGRIEMHLLSIVPQRVTVGGNSFEFGAEETIHTENSCKYSLEEFCELSRAAGFTPVKFWTGDDNLFAVHYLEVA